jgi:hypothetical protein
MVTEFIGWPLSFHDKSYTFDDSWLIFRWLGRAREAEGNTIG